MKLPLALVLPLVWLLTACGQSGTPTTQPGGSSAATVGKSDDHGEKKPLGPLTIGAHTFEVIQYGDVKPDHEASFDLEFPAGKPVPETVRAWIGIESARGSMKAKLGKEGDRGKHGHVDAPATIPANSKVWFEIEENGQTARGSIAWK